MRDAYPGWLTVPARDYAPTARMAAIIGEYDLNTVCVSADCPNAGECFARGTCTFMILGPTCTRHCRFCAVHRGRPAPPDPGEPARVADAARVLGLKHVVVTSVTRDDLPDGGAEHFVATLRELRRLPGVTVELLVPDFGGDRGALEQVLSAKPDVLAHNVETVPRLYERVRPEAAYERSLALLATAARKGGTTKSGLMLGLGETLQEVRQVLADLRATGCDVVTMGQYLRPSNDRLPVVDYVAPRAFAALKLQADALGFRACMAGPLVRSSYHAEETVGARPAGRSGRS